MKNTATQKNIIEKQKPWTHKVIKRQRGMQGQWFDYRTAATFATELDAVQYADTFAREQGEAGVVGTKIDVRTRKGNRTVFSVDVNKYATQMA